LFGTRLLLALLGSTALLTLLTTSLLWVLLTLLFLACHNNDGEKNKGNLWLHYLGRADGGRLTGKVQVFSGCASLMRLIA
jgi:hypothetical protein